MKFKAWDLGGHEAVRHVWDDFMPTADAVVFLVDAADVDRVGEAKDELNAIAADAALFDVPIAVLYNKSDLPFAMPNEDLEKRLDMPSLVLRDGPIKSFRVSVLKGTGYSDAFQWISQFC
jgi:GTP-binding protein SAR1